ncbi:MAG: N-acetyltransferase [Treponema sp.]|nr:N-acetyltransferase [Candidatus Treponema scatequi]
MNNYTIRVEEERDYSTVESLVRESFWNVYRPGCTEHYVLHHLRSNPDFIPELAFVMEADGKIIGQNVFVKAQITKSNGTAFPILTMGPICIANECKRKGYGKILLDYSLEKAAELGYGAVCFEGNIDFYGKSGFCVASKFGIKYHGLPEGMEADFFLCKELKLGYLDGVSGVYATPKAYFVAEENPEDFEAYEKEFNLKNPLVKQKLPGQLV